MKQQVNYSLEGLRKLKKVPDTNEYLHELNGCTCSLSQLRITQISGTNADYWGNMQIKY